MNHLATIKEHSHLHKKTIQLHPSVNWWLYLWFHSYHVNFLEKCLPTISFQTPLKSETIRLQQFKSFSFCDSRRVLYNRKKPLELFFSKKLFILQPLAQMELLLLKELSISLYLLQNSIANSVVVTTVKKMKRWHWNIIMHPLRNHCGPTNCINWENLVMRRDQLSHAGKFSYLVDKFNAGVEE